MTSRIVVAALLAILLGLPVRLGRPSASADGLPVVFVNANVVLSGDGTSWDKAIKFLPTALNKSGDKEIWVAQGTYKPTVNFHVTDKQSATFGVGVGDRVFGGFAGTETERDQRDPAAHETILSGNILDQTLTTDDVRAVVTISASADETAILDGFTVRDSNNNLGTPGGGVLVNGGSPVLTKLHLTDHQGAKGNGIDIVAGSPVVSDIVALNNGGDDVVVRAGTPTLQSLDLTPEGSAKAGVRVLGGSVTVDNVHADVSEFGTGVSVDDGNATITRLVVTVSSTAAGGGVSIRGAGFASVADSTFEGLLSGVFNAGTAKLDRILFHDNLTDMTITAPTTITNSTFDGSSRALDGSASLTAVHSTFTGIEDLLVVNTVVGPNAPILIKRSIIWDTPAPEGIRVDLSLDGNVIEGGCAAFPVAVACTSTIIDDPLLGPLAENGGVTLTRGLGIGSSAIDVFGAAGCPATDQRGTARPVDGDDDGTAGCDLGAFEMVPVLVAFPTSSSAILESAGTGSIAVALSGDHADAIDVSYAVTGGTATAGADFTLPPGTLTLLPHEQNATIGVSVIDDGITEPDETVVVTLSSPTGAFLGPSATHTLTITNTNPSVEFAPASGSVSEGASAAVLTVKLSRANAVPSSVKYAVTGGTAHNGRDFALATGILTFAPGTTLASVHVAINEDLFVEPLETAKVTLSAPGNAVLGANKTFTLSITDNEGRGKCGGRNATIVGTGAGETIRGTAGPDVIMALGGADTINAAGGNDLVCAGGGNDTVNGGGSNDTLFGNNGNDTLTGGNGNDIVSGGGGSDVMRGSGGNDELRGDGGTDQLDGQGGKDRLAGGPGAGDRCTGGGGADSLLPGHGCEAVVGVP